MTKQQFMKNTEVKEKKFECKPRCEFPQIEGVTFNCDKCMKHIMIPLTQEQKEKILVVMNDKDW
jgi:hypothetical protein